MSRIVAARPQSGSSQAAGLARTASLAACLTTLLLASAPPVRAHDLFDTWTTENGLPQNSVASILQTRDGYLWLATFGGLVRFDGTRFVVFDRSTAGIESQRPRELYEDRTGTLWAGTDDGMLIRYRDGKFTTYRVADNLVALRIEEDSDGALWITWWINVVTKFDGVRFTHYGPGELGFGVRPSTTVRDAYLWWSLDAAGLHVFIDGRVRSYSIPRELLRAGVKGLNADRRGNLWIITRGAGVLKVRDGRVVRYTMDDGLPSNDPDGTFREDRRGNVWYSETDWRVYRITKGKHELVSQAGLLDVNETRDGATWLGTNVGLHRLRDVTIAVYSEREGLSRNWVYSILEDRRGVIWIGTWGGGLNRFTAGRFTRYGRADGLPTEWITSLYEQKNGRLWVGTFEGGLTYLQNGRFVFAGDVTGGRPASVWAIHEDRGGTMWFGTETGLVARRSGIITRYTTAHGLAHDRVTALFEDRSGALWIGGARGLTRFKDGVFRAYTERDGLVGNHIRAIYEDTDGVMWIGTYDGGLYRLAADRLTRYTRSDGLFDNGVFQILEDDLGYLWIGSNRGISRVSRAALNDFALGRRRSVPSTAFGTRDGLASVEINGGRQPAGWKTPDGRLWFPTMAGVAVIDPSATRTDTPPPRAIIEEIRLAGNRVEIADQVEVSRDTTTFEIRFTAPSFTRPEQTRFRYKLSGLDDDWVDAGDRRAVTYHRIPPGRYRFVVSAAHQEGPWGSESPAVTIVALPPFWRRWWFITLAVIGSGSLVLAGHERRVRRLQRQHEQQKAFSRQLIDSQEGERRRISNEMHDSFGQDLAIIKKRARTGRERVTDTHLVAGELEAIVGVAEKIGVEVKTIAHALRPYQLDKLGLSRVIENMVRGVAAACEIDITIEIENIDDAFDKDSRIHVYRIVQEGLNNIVKHSNATRARVAIVRDDLSVEIRVDDEGGGFMGGNPARPAGDGFGLMGIRERTRILGGEVEIRSRDGRGTSIVARFACAGTVHA